MTELNCKDVRATFSAYLDGDVSGQQMQEIAEHLQLCCECANEFAAWRSMQESLALLRPAKAPVDLGLKLRLAISHEQSRRTSSIFDTISLHWENSFRPFLLRASAGLASAVALIGSIGFLLGTVAVPQAVLANDEPLGSMTPPHYLYSTTHPQPIRTPQDTTIVVEASVNDQGRVYDYKIVSGPQDATVNNQICDQLVQSVFTPAQVFGAPVRGMVILTFAGISVRG